MRAGLFRKFGASLAAAIWPGSDHCSICGSGALPAMDLDLAFCLPCLAALLWRPGVPCVHCGRPIPAVAGRTLCPECVAGATNALLPALDGLVSLGVYHGLMMNCIRHLKYDGRAELGAPLGELLGLAMLGRVGPREVCGGGWRAVLVPVPLHGDRLAERGYNQAQLIAEGVAGVTGLPLATDVVIRTRGEGTQAGRNRADRLGALTGVFEPGAEATEVKRGSPVDVRGADVMLIDDVLTTGATLASCAGVLRILGARRVFGCTLAAGINRAWWSQEAMSPELSTA